MPVIEYGLCWCGCGEKTAIATRTSTSRNMQKGEPLRYVSGHLHGRKCSDGCKCGRHGSHAREVRRNKQLGKKLTPEVRANMSAAQKARIRDPAVVERTCAAMWEARVAKGFRTAEEVSRQRRATSIADSARRRQVMAGNNGPVESFDRMEIFHRDGGICQICGEPANPFLFHIDHIIPICKGGLHTRSNVQTAHPWCNMSKGVKTYF